MARTCTRSRSLPQACGHCRLRQTDRSVRSYDCVVRRSCTTIDIRLLLFARNTARYATQIYPGTVERIAPFGAFVKILGFSKDGLLHISQLASSRVDNVEDVVSVGDRLFVKVRIAATPLLAVAGTALHHSELSLHMSARQRAIADCSLYGRYVVI
jgi:hypothetical protein